MTYWWGWVDVYEGGKTEVSEYNKETGVALEVTGYTVPDNVAEVMALIDLLPDEVYLKGGSHKSEFSDLTTYYINYVDIQTEGE